MQLLGTLTVGWRVCVCLDCLNSRFYALLGLSTIYLFA